ncbi:hypothetical protein GCM10022222_63940 [Amycolatopsis ultiminotia]|uniref:Uncharacterized protein n=1 Tax=Amycolatopsis ultiminotia TaxID=543629 RepID=A0ABP6XSQ3_9PSEU
MRATPEREPEAVVPVAGVDGRSGRRRVADSALVPPGRPARWQRTPPLPLPGLHSFQPDSSVVMGLGRIDGSVAVPVKAVLRALDWQSGRSIVYRVEAGLVVVVADCRGAGSVPVKGNLVVLYPQEKVNEMVAGFHDALRRSLSSSA